MCHSGFTKRPYCFVTVTTCAGNFALTDGAPVLNVTIGGTEVMRDRPSGNCEWLVTTKTITRIRVVFTGITASSPFCKPDNFVLADGRSNTR